MHGGEKVPLAFEDRRAVCLRTLGSSRVGLKFWGLRLLELIFASWVLARVGSSHHRVVARRMCRATVPTQKREARLLLSPTKEE